MIILQMLSYPFMQRALIAGVLVSLCAALLGVSLVLKRYSMIGDGLSHVSFGALAIAVALGITPLYFSIPVVILAAFFLLRMASHPHWNSDAAIAAVKRMSHLPIIVDPSHATGKRWMVESMAMAAIAAGADGIMCEVHNDPENAWCDGAESITPETFDHMMKKLREIAPIVGREL